MSGLSFSVTIVFARSSKISSAAGGAPSRYSTSVLDHGLGGLAIGRGRTERMYRIAFSARSKRVLRAFSGVPKQALEVDLRRDGRRTRAVATDIGNDAARRWRGFAFGEEGRGAL